MITVGVESVQKNTDCQLWMLLAKLWRRLPRSNLTRMCSGSEPPRS